MTTGFIPKLTRATAAAAAITLFLYAFGDYGILGFAAAGFSAITVLLLVAGAFPGRYSVWQRVAVGVTVAAAMAALGWAVVAYASAMAGFSAGQ